MTQEEFIEKLEEEIKILEEKIQEEDSELSELKTQSYIFKNGNPDSGKIDIDIKSPLSYYGLYAILLRAKTGYTKEIPLSLKKNKKTTVFENIYSEDIIRLLNMFSVELKKGKTIDSVLKIPIGMKVGPTISKEYSEQDMIFTMDEYLRLTNCGDIKKVYPLLEVISKNPEAQKEAFSLLMEVTLLRDTYIKTSSHKGVSKAVIGASKKAAEKISSPCYKQLVGEIASYYDRVVRKDAEARLEVRKEYNDRNEFLRQFKGAMNQQVITDVSFIINSSLDECDKKAALEYVYQHNLSEYQKIKGQVQALSEDKMLLYQELLKNTGIVLTEEIYSSISDKSLEEIRMIVEKIKKYNITDSNSILLILKSGQKASFEVIDKLYEKGLIDNSFLAQNPTIFNGTSPSYQNLVHVLKIIKDKGISYNVIRTNKDVLVRDYKRLEMSLEELESYGLISSVNEDSNLDFLSREDLIDQIDMIIEYGYSTELIENINLLNHSQERWLRLGILKELEELPTDKEELERVLSSETFIVPDDRIRDYVSGNYPDEVKTILGSISSSNDLDMCKKDNLTYEINGNFLSKKKVERNLASFKEDQTSKINKKTSSQK